MTKFSQQNHLKTYLFPDYLHTTILLHVYYFTILYHMHQVSSFVALILKGLSFIYCDLDCTIFIRNGKCMETTHRITLIELQGN